MNADGDFEATKMQWGQAMVLVKKGGRGNFGSLARSGVSRTSSANPLD